MKESGNLSTQNKKSWVFHLTIFLSYLAPLTFLIPESQKQRACLFGRYLKCWVWILLSHLFGWKRKNPSWLWITQLGQLVCSDCPRVSTGKHAKSCGIMEKGHDETVAWSTQPSGEQNSRLTSLLERGDFHRFVVTRMSIDYLPCIVLSYWVDKSYSFLSKMLKLPRQTCFNKDSQYACFNWVSVTSGVLSRQNP